jgi:chromosome segregation ATPase
MSWPIADQSRRHVAAPLQKRRRTPRFVWVLTAAAFLCGGLLSAAGFAIGWKHEAQRGTSAESALVAATAANHSLRAKVASTRALLATAEARSAELATTRRSLVAARAQLLGELARARQKTAGLAAAAAPLSADLARLTNELRALTSYVTATPSSQLDAGYLQAQIAYLAKTADGFSSAVAALHPGR